MTIDQLKTFGANTEEGLRRCLGREDFYLRMVQSGLADAHFDSLAQHLADHDLKAAFEDAHALKGVMATLALDPISRPVSEMTEHLRAGEEMDYTPLLTVVQAKRAELTALL